MRRILALATLLILLSGCLESSSRLSFSGNGRGENDGSLHCSKGVRVHIEGDLKAGTFDVSVKDPDGTERLSKTFRPGTATVDEKYEASGGTWHIVATRAQDFDGSGSILTKCL